VARRVLAQQPTIKGAPGIDGDIDRGSRELALGNEVEYPRADVRLSELIGKMPMKLRQIGHINRVVLHGPCGFLLQDQMLDEPLTQGRDRPRAGLSGIGGTGG